MPDLSVIIVSYKVRDALADCLRSLGAHSGPLSCQTIVVDNASGDGTPELVAKVFPSITLVANAENRGFAAACNQGAALATGRNVLLLNPDTTVHPGALAAMAAFLDRTEDAGVVGCPIYDDRGRQRLSCFPLPTVGSVLWQHWQVYRLSPPLLYTRYRGQALRGNGQPFPVGWVTGACFMTKRSIMEQLGGLDEGYFLFVEEVDFCRRAAERGWRSYFLPGPGVVHSESRSTSQVVPLKLRSHYVSKLRYFAKFESPRSLALLRTVFLVELAAKIVIRAAGAPLRYPPDASARLAAYWSIARECLTYPAKSHPALAE